MRALLVCLAGFATFASTASPQVAYRATAIPASNDEASSFPRGFQPLGNRLLFSASRYGADFEPGVVLWSTDGTPTGTEELGPLCENACSVLSESPLPLAVRGALAFWSLPISSNNDRCANINLQATLFRTDGTAEGTFPLSSCELAVVADPVGPFGGRYVFAASRDFGGYGIWSTDGTPEGTRELLIPGSGLISQLVAVGSRAIFFTFADDGRTEVWQSDGTLAQTRKLFDLPGLQIAGPRLFGAIGNRVLFEAATELGRELWATDGTLAGTVPITDLDDGSLGIESGLLDLGPSNAFFLAAEPETGREIWVTDGTRTGTRRVSDLRDPEPFDFSFDGRGLAQVGGKVYAILGDRFTDAPKELWSFDLEHGPSSSTRLATLCREGFCNLEQGLVALGDRVYFQNLDPTAGVELWSSAGTPRTTGLAADLCAGSCSGHPTQLQVLGNTLYLTASDAGSRQFLWSLQPDGSRDRLAQLSSEFRLAAENLVGQLGTTIVFPSAGERADVELWALHGGTDRPQLIADLERATQSGPELLEIEEVGGRVLTLSGSRTFAGGYRLWASNPRVASSILLKEDLRCSSLLLGTVDCLFPIGPQTTVFLDGPTGVTELWRTDGTSAGTYSIWRPAQANPTQNLTPLGILGSRLFFLANGPEPGNSPRAFLWETDGTSEGTRSLGELGAITAGSLVLGRLTLDETLYLVVAVGSGLELWRSDGTLGGTVRVEALPSTVFFSDTQIALVPLGDGLAVISADSRGGGRRRVSYLPQRRSPSVTLFDDPCSAATPDRGADVAVLGGEMYLLRCPGFGRPVELTKTDGTPEGTATVQTFPGWSGGAQVSQAGLVATSDRIFFAAYDPSEGFGPWVTDGTASGTRRLARSPARRLNKELRFLGSAGERAFFLSDNDVHGLELWTTDGTEEGTQLAHDIAPGKRSSSYGPSRFTSNSLPLGLLRTVDRLYFPADDGISGTQLWSLPLTPSTRPCADSPVGLCLQGDRFRAEVRWEDFQGNVGYGRPTSLTPDTGTFWFFDPANVELITKVLDGRPLNDHFWAFFGALSNVAYDLTLTDTETGLTRRYSNPAGRLASAADTRAFGEGGSALASFTAPADDIWGSSHAEVATAVTPKAASGTCEPSPLRLCLNQGRFAVEASWRDFQGITGVGQARSLTGDTGTFWFFAPENLEVVLKVLDGTALNGKFWVFYGALSNVEYTLTVTDTTTGLQKTYRNPAGNLASVADTGAF